MKGKENMREWRRLGKRQDHNERQKDRTKERWVGNQNTAWRTRNRTASANLRHGSSSCIPFSQLEWLCFSRSIDVTYRSHEIFRRVGLPASCSTMTFDVVTLSTRKFWCRQDSNQRIALLGITYWKHCYHNSVERYGWHKQLGKEILSH